MALRVVISQTSGAPLYEQIVDQVRQQILSGELEAGSPMPSLRALAAELRVSLITTTRAYNELAAEGLIVNAPARGSFVAELDQAQVKEGALNHAREALRQIVARARPTELVTLEELTAMLKEEWDR